MDDPEMLGRRLEKLLAMTEGFVDGSHLAEQTKAGEETEPRVMAWRQMLSQNKREGQAGRIQAASARHHALIAQKALQEGDEKTAISSLLYGQQRLAEAMKAQPDIAKLTTVPKELGRPAEGKDVTLYRQAEALRKKNGMTIPDACTAALAANNDLVAGFKNTTDGALLKAFQRGRKKVEGQKS